MMGGKKMRILEAKERRETRMAGLGGSPRELAGADRREGLSAGQRDRIGPPSFQVQAPGRWV